MARYDIAILGTGPAGVSAAITAKIRNKNILLLGSANLSDKLQKAHAIQNYPGLPDIPGAELAAAFRRHLDQLGIAITEEKVSAVYSMAVSRCRSPSRSPACGSPLTIRASSTVNVPNGARLTSSWRSGSSKRRNTASS